MPILLNKTIRLFLDSIGRREEYEYYLNKFQHAPTSSFAALCPVREGFEEVAPVFGFDLDALRRMELFPVIVLSGEHAEEMHGILLREEHPYDTLKFSKASAVDEASVFVEACRNRHSTGIIVAPDDELESLLKRFVPQLVRRVHIIRPQGHLHSADDRELSYYYTAKPDAPILRDEDRWIAELAAGLLGVYPGTHFSVATPWNLLQELFTVKGAGCVIRKGSIIKCYEAFEQIDVARLRVLLEESFRKPLSRDNILNEMDVVYLEEGYQGAALLEQQDAGMYLSKFAVGVEARGAGLAQELWQLVIDEHPRMFWRARENNPVNQWYEKQAHGYFKADGWRVFWRGIDAEDVSAVIRYSLDRPEDFVG